MSTEYEEEYVGESVPLLIAMAAGCIAGAIEGTVTWPMEYIKTQLQLQRRPIRKMISPLSVVPLASLDSCVDEHLVCDSPRMHAQVMEEGEVRESKVITIAPPPPPFCMDTTPPPPYTGMISGIVYTVRTHGFWALYTGLAPTLLGSIPKVGIRFFLFAFFSDLLRDGDGNLSVAMVFLAGLASGAIEAAVVVVPAETIKTKCIQMNMPFLEGLKEILLNEGIRGIYHGVLPTILRQSSNHGLGFMWYYEYKRIVSNDGEFDLTLLQSLIGGMTSGLFSATGNHPFDVLKTRMQGVHAAEEYSSTWDCICQTFRREGIAGFYTGIIPRLAKLVPGHGIIFMSYDIIVTLLVALLY